MGEDVEVTLQIRAQHRAENGTMIDTPAFLGVFVGHGATHVDAANAAIAQLSAWIVANS